MCIILWEKLKKLQLRIQRFDKKLRRVLRVVRAGMAKTPEIKTHTQPATLVTCHRIVDPFDYVCTLR